MTIVFILFPDRWNNLLFCFENKVNTWEYNHEHVDNNITQLGFENSSAKHLPINAVLMAMYGATAGQVSFLKFYF